MDKSILGIRFTCFKCGTKFYDLNRPETICPECGADQAEAPVKDLKDIIRSNKRRRKRKQQEEEEAPPPVASDDDDDVDDVDDLFDDDDDGEDEDAD